MCRFRSFGIGGHKGKPVAVASEKVTFALGVSQEETWMLADVRFKISFRFPFQKPHSIFRGVSQVLFFGWSRRGTQVAS